MGQRAHRVFTQPGDIERLAALCAQLHDSEPMALRLEDGERVTGVVATRPILQTFVDADGNEGTNAVLRLEQEAPGGDARLLWLDTVCDVEALGEAGPGQRVRDEFHAHHPTEEKETPP